MPTSDKKPGATKMPTDVWPQRGVFADLIRDYLKKTGSRQADFAEKVGTTTGTLRQWLYNSRRKPDIKNLILVSSLLGCPITTFIDNPSENIPGIPVGKTEEERVMVRRMAEDLSGMSSRQRHSALEVWASLVRAIKC